MRITASILALGATLLAAIAQAQSGSNPFNVPSGGYRINAGSTVNLSWQPNTPGTVSLVLRYGNPGALDPGTTIASQIPNTGTFSWSIPSSQPAGDYYTVEIISDQNPSTDTNYTPQINILSSNTNSPYVTSSGLTATSPATPTVTPTSPTPASTVTPATITPSSGALTKSTTVSFISPSAGSHSTNTPFVFPSGNAQTTVPTSTATGGMPRMSAAGAVAGLVAAGLGAVAAL